LRKPVISLVSDFGSRDPYVAEMKAVILNIYENAQIVDISHEIDKFDVRMGAFLLASAAPHFPKGTVHVAIVDPGVGTMRRPIIVETEKNLFVGPDNGVLMLAAEKEGIKHVYMISNKKFMLQKVSSTFHGRDVFAPVAAYLAKGHSPTEIGFEISDYIIPEFAKPTVKARTLIGKVLYVDSFGNVFTNISTKHLDKINAKVGDSLLIKLNEKTLRLKYCTAYGEVNANELLTVVGGHGFIEISANQSNASQRLNIKPRISIQISKA